MQAGFNSVKSGFESPMSLQVVLANKLKKPTKWRRNRVDPWYPDPEMLSWPRRGIASLGRGAYTEQKGASGAIQDPSLERRVGGAGHKGSSASSCG